MEEVLLGRASDSRDLGVLLGVHPAEIIRKVTYLSYRD